MNKRRRWKAKARRRAARETQLGTSWWMNKALQWNKREPRTIYDQRVRMERRRYYGVLRGAAFIA
jgi:hypothetical protein